MNYTDHKITLDIHSSVSPVTIRMKKRESMRRLLIHLTEAGYPYHISEECRAVFTAKKPDGKVLFNHCTIDDCVITYGVTEQTTAVPGLIPCEIQLYGADDALLVSSRFNIVVEDTVYDDDAEIESTQEANALTALISDATEAIGEANDVAAGLLEAKEKGEFNGPKGDPGKDGVSINGTGVDSVVLNSKNPEQASGDNSLAEGYRTNASGNRSHAEGDCTEAGWRSHAEGFLTLANNTSHAGGRLSKATGKGSFAHGVENYVSPARTIIVKGTPDSATLKVSVGFDVINDVLQIGEYIRLVGALNENNMPPTDCRKIVDISSDGKTITVEYPFGDVNYTSSFDTICEVQVAVGCEASGYGAHAEGYSTSAIGGEDVHAPHAEGKLTKASATGAHAEGNNTTASGFASHAEGNASKATNTSAHAEGYSTTASGGQAHAEGARTVASGTNSHAEGADTSARAEGSHSEGKLTEATNTGAHAEGNKTVSSGFASHAEGNASRATNTSAHAEGFNTTASGAQSHTEGARAVASGSNSHAEGADTIAKGDAQHAQGRFNIEDTANKYAHIVGNGSSDTKRSNAHTVDWNGNAWFAGDVYVGGTGQDDPKAEKLVKSSELVGFTKTSDLKMKLVATGSVTNTTSGFFTLSSVLEVGKNYLITFYYDDEYYSVYVYQRSATTGSASTGFLFVYDGSYRHGQFFVNYLGKGGLIRGDCPSSVFSSISEIEVYELPY